MDVKLSTKFRNDFLGSKTVREIFEDAVINIYEGTPPDSADYAVDGTLLATITKAGGTVSLGEVSTAQESKFTISTHASGQEYVVLVNGVGFTYVNTPDLSAIGIATAIVESINNLGAGVVASSCGTATVYVRSTVRGASFTLTVVTNGTVVVAEDCSDIADWTTSDVVTATQDGKSVFHFIDTCNCYRDIGTLADEFEINIGFYREPINYFHVEVERTGLKLKLSWLTTALYVYYDATHYTTLFSSHYEGSFYNTWNDWKFVVHCGTPATATVDIYKNNVLLESGVSCAYTGVFTEGLCTLTGAGSGGADAYVDYFNVNEITEETVTEGVASAAADTLRFGEAEEYTSGTSIIQKNSDDWSGTAVATGTATYFRIVNSSDEGTSDVVTMAYPRIQGDIGISNTAMIRGNLSIASGTVQTVTSATITMPSG